MDYTAKALGLEIKGRRERLGMSQDELGVKAGYGKGAGVAISRIESGITRPTKPRLAGIADALGFTPERIEGLASVRSLGSAGAGTGSETRVGGRKRAVRDRLIEVQERTKLRTDCIEDLGSSFNDAHNRARDDYFLRFVDIAKGIEDAPPPELPTEKDLPDPDGGTPGARTVAAEMTILSHHIAAALVGAAGGAAAGAALGGTTAYATFTGAAMLRSASTGIPISALSGVAATNATLAVLGGGTLAAGGGGMAAGTLLLTGIVAAPTVVLFAGGLYLAHRRNKSQEAKLNAQLDVAEASLDGTQAGFDLLADTLTRATATLDYIGVHAAHALEKWERGLGARPIMWESLTAEQQQSYRHFIDIAACELAVDSIEAAQFMTIEGKDLESLESGIAATLDYADTTVRALV